MTNIPPLLPVIISSLALFISGVSLYFNAKNRKIDKSIEYLNYALAAQYKIKSIKKSLHERHQVHLDNKNIMNDSPQSESALNNLIKHKSNLDQLLNEMESEIEGLLNDHEHSRKGSLYMIKSLESKFNQISLLYDI